MIHRQVTQNALAIVVGLALAGATYLALSSRANELDKDTLNKTAVQIAGALSRDMTLATETIAVTSPVLTGEDGQELFAGMAARLFAGRPDARHAALRILGVTTYGADDAQMLTRQRPSEPNRVNIFSEQIDRDKALIGELRASALSGAPAIAKISDARLMGSSAGKVHFWIVWREAGLNTVALTEVDILPLTAASVVDMKELTVRVQYQADPTESATALDDLDRNFGSAVSAMQSTPFGSGVIEVTVTSSSGGFFGRRANDGIAAVFAGLAFAMALYSLMRAERLRVARLTSQNKVILRTIGHKQKELERAQERFQHLTQSTNVIPWTADLDKQVFTYMGPQIVDLTAQPMETWLSAGFWAHHIHPGDRPAVLEKLRQCKAESYLTLNYRLRTADGRIIHVRNMLSVLVRRDPDGRLKTIAQGFILDVTEMTLAADALSEAKLRAEDANRIKSEFLANMSHELRTPLNAVIGFSEIMKDELFGKLPPQYLEYAQSVHASGKHLLHLINDVLDLSKIEAGRVELDLEETKLEDIIEDCHTLLQERIGSAGLHFQTEIDTDLPSAFVDSRRIKQVILNLMANAVKFTPPGGTITVVATYEANVGARISVIDTGVGMSPEEIPKALTKFGQIDGDLTRAHDGTGLGLPIAKSLIEMHGGELEIFSEKGRGTEVLIWLPEERLNLSQAA
ncbi:MAG: PAS domain-containing sensor histidine kinase [Pseudomonadota bacterium]